MRTLAALLGIVLFLPAAGLAQPRANVFTEARLPDQAQLDRLDLKPVFLTTLPVEHLKDGVASMQLMDRLLVIQLRSGFVVAYNAETGAIQWSTRPGMPYPRVILDAASDDRYVIVVRDVHLHAFNRLTGQLEWSFELPTIPSSAPTSDGERLFIVLSGDQLHCFDLPLRPEQMNVVREGFVTTSKQQAPPRVDEKERAERARVYTAATPEPSETARLVPSTVPGARSTQSTPSIAVVESVVPPYRLTGTRQRTASLAVLPSVWPPFKINSEVQSTPSIAVVHSVARVDELSQKHLPPPAIKKRWQLSLPFRVSQAPVVTSTLAIVASTERTVLGTPKLVAQRMYSADASGNISAQVGQFGDMLFVPTFDSNFYAVDGAHGRILWRFTTDSPVISKPMVIGNEVFLTTVDGQLYRLSREDGDSAWKDARGFDRFVPEVKSFVSANDQFVYVIDYRGRLEAIDRRRGTRLQNLPVRDFPFALANDQTDRIYLASNDGTVICLRDRDLAQPVRHPQKAPPPSTETGIALPPVVEKPKVPFPDKPKPPAKPKEKDTASKDDTPKKEDKPKKGPAKKDDTPKKDDMPKKDDKPGAGKE
jgi:outer membrane protein assembly factor BamB